MRFLNYLKPNWNNQMEKWNKNNYLKTIQNDYNTAGDRQT